MRKKIANDLLKPLETYGKYEGVLEYDTYTLGDDLGVTFYGNGEQIGYIRGQKLDYKNFQSLQKVRDCYPDVVNLAEMGGSDVCDRKKGVSCLLPRVFMITDSDLDTNDNQGTSLRGTGIGRMMYEAIFTEFYEDQKNKDFIAVPMKCIFGRSSTSSDAQRVWNSLARTLESSNDLVLVDRPLIF